MEWAVLITFAVRLSSSRYIPFEGQPIHLTDVQRDDVEEIARSNALPAGFVQRAKIVLLFVEGGSARAVETKLHVSRSDHRQAAPASSAVGAPRHPPRRHLEGNQPHRRPWNRPRTDVDRVRIDFPTAAPRPRTRASKHLTSGLQHPREPTGCLIHQYPVRGRT